ncbi:hypothetical protein KA005_01175 [bacterium]|nr:hypothetical protein [bacterium]
MKIRKLFNQQWRKRSLILVALILYLGCFCLLYVVTKSDLLLVLYVGLLVLVAGFLGIKIGLIGCFMGALVTACLTYWIQSQQISAMVRVFVIAFIYYLLTCGVIAYFRHIHKKQLNAAHEINGLEGMLPVCANCKKVRIDNDRWEDLDTYVKNNTRLKISHSLCPDCISKLYPQVNIHKKEYPSSS